MNSGTASTCEFLIKKIGPSDRIQIYPDLEFHAYLSLLFLLLHMLSFAQIKLTSCESCLSTKSKLIINPTENKIHINIWSFEPDANVSDLEFYG